MSKLKGLYVAVTRARNNLRIIDESEKGEPMRVSAYLTLLFPNHPLTSLTGFVGKSKSNY